MNRKTSWDSIPYKSKCFFAGFMNCVASKCSPHSAFDVQVVFFLLHEILTTEMYHPCFTSASDEKHTITI